MTSSLDDVWAALRGVHSLRFEARSETGSGWDGVGDGSVVVSSPGDDVLVFAECGAWQPRGRSTLNFINTYRWTRLADSLRLEHLRFGVDRPVPLFEMAPDEAGEWRDVSPHLCDQDYYSARLTLEPDRLHLTWTVSGPTKRETIAYEYW